MKDTSFHNDSASDFIGLSAVVDVFDQDELFDQLDNEAVLALSQLGGNRGFSDIRAIKKSTGISNRRLLKSAMRPIDVAVQLCRRLECVTDMRLGDFQHILLCHSHTDVHACEVLAAEITTAFNLPTGSIAAFNFGCSGFLKLAAEGSLLLEDCDRGSKVALLSVETPEYWHDGSDRLFCGIVSAGATAAVLEVGHGLPMSVVRSDDFRIPAERRPNPDPLFHKETAEVFDFRGVLGDRTVMRMNPEPVFLNGIELMLDNLRSALLSIQCAPGQRVIVAPHQPSGKLLKALVAAARTEFPEIEFLNNLEFYGNTISSSVPTLVSRLDEVLERNKIAPLNDGDHLILLAAGICMTEIADHMSAGHACLTWKNGVLNEKADVTSTVDAQVYVGEPGR
ncbi:3-oxoacyl-[acyl-carrier-protein] synthase III C-terminal domain-containing protein [Fuerstiella marisgermanici]|uniref:3-oxoacyl-[acyl-carrier-protein] synthase 3 n=1 Tax=Fuerstiella marisgermanici TaxID=1891926 RepID=A0A1P8WLC3_9PLAN|nr:3-oxoacyl-[acyl-carrier-protein] synthase III C-terminal domain-containing protein [Fuerstiella marisgermanici]APZ94864.1 3-oxoacyl-[acyl-carrier-protein] synthase 3 [Fuerstiella marisgermanici]